MLLSWPSLVIAQISDTYIARISERCVLVKEILDKQQRKDLVTRINVGRDYQNAIAQQQAFLTRLKSNNLPTEQFQLQTQLVEAELDRLRSSGGAYNQYDDALGGLLDIDCKEKPLDFAIQLQKTRDLRFAVGQQVSRVDATLARYREMIVNLQTELQQVSNAVLGEAE